MAECNLEQIHPDGNREKYRWTDIATQAKSNTIKKKNT